MDRELATVIVVGIFILAVAGMLLGWRARSHQQTGIAALGPVPEETGDVLASAHGLYVATSVHGDPLDRIAVRGLGFRSRASITVARAGIMVVLTGLEPFFIAVGQLRSSQWATWTVDKGVEKDGLFVITWILGDQKVDSYFRLDGDFDDLVATVNGLMEVQK